MVAGSPTGDSILGVITCHLQQAPLIEYQQVDIMQILRADRAAWTYMAEKANFLKKHADGSLPMDDLLLRSLELLRL